MVEKYINATFIRLIEKSDYLPIRDQNGSLIIRDDLKVLHRFINGMNIIVDLVNGDILSPEEIKEKINTNNNLLFSNSSKGDFLLYTVFVFTSTPEIEKLNVIKLSQAEEYSGSKVASCLSINLSSKELVKHFKIPPTTYGLDKTLEGLMSSDKYQYEALPDVYELVNRKLESFKIDFKTKVPVISYALLAINIAVFVLFNLYSNYLTNAPPIDYIINQRSYGNLYNYLIFNYGAKVNQYIISGEFWRLITPIFLHGSMIHLLSNSYFLFSMGKMVEGMYGNAKYIFVYMIAGIIGNIASFAFSPSWSIGASGALMGMIGALLYYGIENPSQFKRYFGYNVISIIVINAAFGFTNPGIDNYAHFGGLLGGFLASGIVGLGKANNKYFNRYIAAVLTAIVSVAGLLYGFR